MSRHKPVGRLSTEAEASQVALEVGRSQEALSVPKVSEIGEAWESQHTQEAVEGSIMVVWALKPKKHGLALFLTV